MSGVYSIYLKILVLLGMIIFFPGCESKSLPNQFHSGSAAQLMANSLNVMEKTGSYRFKGTGSVQYIGIGSQGAFTVTGAYKSPGYSHMKMKMKLGGANYHSETFYKNDTIYQLSNEYWKKVPFDPNTLIQPGYKPVKIILAQLPEVSLNPVSMQDGILNGKIVKVIRAPSNTRKFKIYLQKHLDRTISREPERRQELANFSKNCSVLQNYTLYVDPETKRILKILFRQNVRVTLSNKKTETHMDAEYTIYDFENDVDLPSVPGKIK